MSNADFPLLADEGPEDLPRTLRREKEAREREAREREAKARAATLTHDFGASDAAFEPHRPPVPAAVTRFEVPFLQLMLFFIKAVFAAIPALIILGVLLWFAGQALKSAYPKLIHTEIVIRVPR